MVIRSQRRSVAHGRPIPMRIVPQPNSRARLFEGKRYVDSEMQLVAVATAAKGIPRAGNVRYHTIGRAVKRVWETRHVRRDTEWHPKRATSRATDTVNIAFGTGTFIGCYMRSPGRNIFQACQAESPVLSLSGPGSTAPGRCCVAS